MSERWTEITGQRLKELRATLYGRTFGIARAVELSDGTLRILPGRTLAVPT